MWQKLFKDRTCYRSYSFYGSRQLSFYDRSLSDEWAKAGFFYKKNSDTVICFCCGIKLKYRREHVDPLMEHWKLNQNCRFLNENYSLPSEPLYQYGICLICQENVIDVIFMTCLHAYACINCAVRLQRCCFCKKNLSPIDKKKFYLG